MSKEQAIKLYHDSEYKEAFSMFVQLLKDKKFSVEKIAINISDDELKKFADDTPIQKVDDDCLTFLYYCGKIYQKLEQPTAARSMFQILNKSNNNRNSDAHYELAKSYYEEAIKELRKLINTTLKPTEINDEINSCKKLAESYHTNLKEIDDSYHGFSELNNLKEELIKTENTIKCKEAIDLYNQGNYEEAFPVFVEILKTNGFPAEKLTITTSEGDVQQIIGEQLSKKAENNNDEFLNALLYCGRIYKKLGKNNAALSMFFMETNSNNNDRKAEAHFEIASLYYEGAIKGLNALINNQVEHKKDTFDAINSNRNSANEYYEKLKSLNASYKEIPQLEELSKNVTEKFEEFYNSVIQQVAPQIEEYKNAKTYKEADELYFKIHSSFTNLLSTYDSLSEIKVKLHYEFAKFMYGHAEKKIEAYKAEEIDLINSPLKLASINTIIMQAVLQTSFIKNQTMIDELNSLNEKVNKAYNEENEKLKTAKEAEAERAIKAKEDNAKQATAKYEKYTRIAKYVAGFALVALLGYFGGKRVLNSVSGQNFVKAVSEKMPEINVNLPKIRQTLEDKIKVVINSVRTPRA
ncbi:MAG: hypothetical protein J0H68_07325 [Sphingobacteriia bacterium]|nr:hypothetical protein [Sphingobacteriia bacterium]